MPKNYIVKVSEGEVRTAYETMETNQLLFFPNSWNSINKLTSFVQKKNYRLYNKLQFEFIETRYDPNVIIAAVPKLGPNQLGIFAAKEFEKDEIIGVYQGEDLWGELPVSKMEEKINQCKKQGDYFWQINTKHGSKVIDSTFKGTFARFVNDSLRTNAYVSVSQGQLYYKAKERIPFGKEITVSYGENYFNKEHPRHEYIPDSLSTILNNLYTHLISDGITPLNNVEEVYNFLTIFGWDLKDERGKCPTQVEKLLKLPMKRLNSELKKTLNTKKRPSIFDLSDNTQEALLTNTIPAKIVKTSTYKLFLGPTNHNIGSSSFSLFAGELIKKESTVCEIKGENVTKKQIKESDLDPNFIFEINSSVNLYCKNLGSEARFVQGVCNLSEANVKVVFQNKAAKYVALTDILPGQEIVAFYGKNYELAKTPTDLETVVNYLNSQQLYWDCLLSYDAVKGTYSISFREHIRTPGRDFVDDVTSPVSTSVITENNVPTLVIEKSQVQISDVYGTNTKHFFVPGIVKKQDDRSKSVVPVWPSLYFNPQFQSKKRSSEGLEESDQQANKKIRPGNFTPE